MANLENNNDNENKKSIAENIGDQIQNTAEKVQETVQDAKELASDAMNHPIETAEEFGKQAAKDVTNYKWWAKLLLLIFWISLFLTATFFVVVSLPATKNWAAQKVMKSLNKSLKTQLSLETIDVNYFGNVTIHNVTIKDYKGFNFIKAKEVYADSNWFSILSNSRDLKFQSLSLDKMDLKVITYKGDSISNFVRFIDLFNTGPRDPKKTPFQLKSRISITNSKVSIVNQNHDGDAGKWLNASDFNIVIPELKVNGAEVSAQINNARFTTERWGRKHILETFSTYFELKKDFLNLKDLTLETDHSLLQGDIKFNLNNGSWADFENKVVWNMKLKPGSQISGYDIRYFVTNWDNYKPINISGKLTGPLENFALENFVISNNKVGVRTNKLIVQHFLKDNFLVKTDQLSTDFTYVELKEMLPTFIAKNLKNIADDFGRLKYNGALNATQKQIYIPNANLITGIGQAKIAQFYLNDYLTPIPKYHGNAVLKDFNTSVVSKNKQVGLISGNFNFEGESFDVNTMKLKTKSQIASIEIMDKEINNLYLDGTLDHKTYNGIININDEQAKANVTGFIDFRTKKITANVNADVKYLNINYFTGGKGNQIVNGEVVGKIAMTNLNDLNLDADFKNVNFATAAQKFHIPNAKIKAFFENGNRIVSVDAPNAVNGKISGKYNLEDLQGMIQNGLGKILVGPPPRKLYKGQNFSMNFEVKQDLINYFEPNLKIRNGAIVSGSYDGDANHLILNADVASLKYFTTTKEEITDADKALAAANPAYKIKENSIIKKDSASVENLSLRINTANIDEQIYAKIDRAVYQNNIFKEVALIGRNENNQLLHLAAQFKLGSPEDELNNQLKEYSVNVNQSTNSSGDYVFRFEPTTVKFNNIAWSIDTSEELNHSITYRKKTSDFLIQNLKIFSDNSALLVNSAVFKSAKDFEADAVLKNFQISKLLEMQSGGNTLDIKGVANGSVKIKMNKNNLEPLIDMTVENILMNGQDLGNIIITAKNSSVPNIFDIDAKVVSAGIIGDNNLHVTGTINNNTSSPTLDIKAEMNDFNLAFANQFVKGVFSNFRGKANGILSISGSLKDINYSGDIALKDFGLKLNFTEVDYTFDDTVIGLSKGLAILNNIGVHDGRTNSKGSVSGAIQFETLSSMGVNLIMRADNLLVLDTQQKNNDLFWGRIYGQGDLYVSGPVSGLDISTPNMKAINNSIFTFNSNSTSNVDEYKMLRFLKEDKAGVVILENKKKSGANVNVDFKVDVDKSTTVNVLVGDEVGDISVRGIANGLGFHMSRQGTISLDGTYIVDNGTFTSKKVLNKTFQIAKASSIQWDGDAMTPSLDISANYVRTVSNAGDYLNMGSAVQPVNVMLQTKITQTLNNPKIDLGVSILDASSQLKETLATKMNQEDEKIKQFGSILLLNRFIVEDISLDAVAIDNGTGILFKQLSSVLNTISNEFQVDLNYVGGDTNTKTGNRANAGLTVALSPKIKVKTGLGIPLSKTDATQTNYLSGEGTIEYDVSKKNDGSMVLKVYSKPTNIGMTTTSTNGASNQTYGGGIAWSKSFNTLFKRSKKNKKKKPENTEIKKDSIKKDTIK